MRYTCSIDIDLPRERVVALFDDLANLKRWQTNLRRYERVSGVPGEVGTVTRLIYAHGTKERVMTETVTRRELPDRFTGTYTMDGVWNEVDCRFQVLGVEKTRWQCEVEFRFDSLLFRIMGAIVPGMFRKQTQKFMQQFKEFAESQTDEALERTRFEPQ